VEVEDRGGRSQIVGRIRRKKKKNTGLVVPGAWQTCSAIRCSLRNSFIRAQCASATASFTEYYGGYPSDMRKNRVLKRRARFANDRLQLFPSYIYRTFSGYGFFTVFSSALSRCHCLRH